MRAVIPRIRESKFRGLERYKLTHASLPLQKTFELIAQGPALKPENFIRELESVSQVSNPSLSVLSVLSARAAVLADQLYPPQILNILQLFSKISFSDPTSLFNLVVSRKADLLANASPKRTVLLMEAMTRLHLPLFHESIWPELRQELVRVLPMLIRGVACVLASLARAGCTDTELIKALVAQAECVKGEVELEFFYKAIESASRMHASADFLREHIDRPVSTGGLITCFIAAAAARSQADSLDFYLEKLNEKLEIGSLYERARLVQAIARFGLQGGARLSQSVAACIETAVASDADFTHKFLPYTLFSGAVIGGIDSTVSFAIQSLVNRKQTDRLSAEKLLCLLRAARITNSDESVIEALKENLKPVSRQLTVRQSRCLWEVLPGFVPVSALPPLTRRGKESDVIDFETVGPYNLLKTSGDVLEFLVPEFQVVRPGGSNIRPDARLRLNSLIAAAPNRPVVYSHKFS